MKPPFVEQLPSETVECPLFITWDKQKRASTFELRGCIGTLSPKPLVSSIGEYALISALRDKRFEPVSIQEVPSLRVAVSLLVNYEECSHSLDWEVGVHGIIIRFYASDADAKMLGRGMEYSATFLPEVAEQQGWDQYKTVKSLVRKTGYKGTLTETLLNKIRCTRYQSSKHKLTFEEYAQQLGGDPSKFITTIGDFDDVSNSPNNNCRLM